MKDYIESVMRNQKKVALRHNNARYSCDNVVNFASVKLSDADAAHRMGNHDLAAKNFLMAIIGTSCEQ